MDSLVKLETQFDDIKTRRKEAILKAFDGRTQQNISDRTGIEFSKLNKWINGLGSLEDIELTKLEKLLGADFK
jgi:hypothetical protein